MKFMIEKLNWDSDFFQIKIGEVNYEDIKAINEKLDFDLLYVYNLSSFDLQLENFENTFSEAKVIFTKEIDKNRDLNATIFSIDDVKVTSENLYKLAFESGKNSRFLLDNKFQLNDFQRLYKIWVDNSVSKKIADDVLIYIEDSKPIGFVTYKIKDKNATIGLIAVDSKSQGKGIGGKLVNHLESILYQKEIKNLRIPTQLANIQACNFYKKQGYLIKETKYIKHYWKK